MKKVLLVGSVVFCFLGNSLRAVGTDFVAIEEPIAVEDGTEIFALQQRLSDLTACAQTLFGDDLLIHAKKLKQAKGVREKMIKALQEPAARSLGRGVADVLDVLQATPPNGKSVLDCLPHYAQCIKGLLNPPKRASVHFAEPASAFYRPDSTRISMRPVSPPVFLALENFARLELSDDVDVVVAEQDFGNLLARLTKYQLVARVDDQIQETITEFSKHIDAGTCTRDLIAAVAKRLLDVLAKNREEAGGAVAVSASGRSSMLRVDSGDIFRRLGMILQHVDLGADIPVRGVEPLVGIAQELLRILPTRNFEVESRWPAIRGALEVLADLRLEGSVQTVLDAESTVVIRNAIEALQEAATLLDIGFVVPARVADVPVRQHHVQGGAGCCKLTRCDVAMIASILVFIFAYTIECAAMRTMYL